MAIKAKWMKNGLKELIFVSINDAINTIRATLLKLGMNEHDVDNVCLIKRTSLDTAIGKFSESCIFGDRPVSLAYTEIMLIVHCAVIKACKEHGATEAVDLGLSSMARRNFYRMFASLDTRKWIVFLQGEVLEYMKAFVKDDYAVDPETFCIMDQHNKRLFDASSL